MTTKKVSWKEYLKNLNQEDKLKLKAIRLIVKILVIIGAVFIVTNFVFGICICHDSDNFPSIKDGDLIITYRCSKYYSGDLVAYRQNAKTRFGRVVGVAGDVIDISEDTYSVNGLYPNENVYYRTLPDKDSNITYPHMVEDGAVFVLNDYREDAGDSRQFGAVKTSDLQGRIVLMLRRRGF